MPIHDARRLLLPALVLTCGVLACSSDSTGPGDPGPASIEVSPAGHSFGALGDTLRFTATVRDQNGGVVQSAPVSWSTSSASVASVSTSGLVTAVGNGNVVLTARAAGLTRDVSVTVQQVAARLRFTPDPVTLPGVGDTVTVTATVVDANDNPMPLQPITWSSADPSVVEVSNAGHLRAVGEGATRVEASTGPVTSALAAFVGYADVVVTSVSPTPWVEGAEATIEGLGFSPTPAENVVSLDGVPAVVTRASSVELRIRVPDADCRPARNDGVVRVSARNRTAQWVVAVRPAVVFDLGVGEGVFATDGCLHLAEGTAAERYMIGVLSNSEIPSRLTPARLAARAGTSGLVTAPARTTSVTSDRVGSSWGGVRSFSAPRPPSGSEAVAGAPTTGAPSGAAAAGEGLTPVYVDRSGEAKIREAERAWLESLGPLTPRAPSASGPLAAPLAAPPALNDTLEITVPAAANSCNIGDEVRAVVRYVGESAVFLEDVENPDDGFTDAEYEALDDELTSRTLPIIQAFFGDMQDVDDNERALVLLTKEVNKRENLAGFVFAGDLISLLGNATCLTSNNAEIFYGVAPDAAGIYGTPRAKNDLLLQYPPLIAHELTHVLQFTTLFTVPTSSAGRTSWELEGGATLAEQLVGYDVFDHLPRTNLGYLDWRKGASSADNVPDWYRDWVTDMALYFGWKGNEPRAPNAPEQCSWIGRDSEGNVGPCENSRAVYGVPSTLLRFVLDWYGPEYQTSTLLGDAQLMRLLTRSPRYGLAALEDATGADRNELLVTFAAAMWADNRPGLGDWIPSWNVYDIFQNVTAGARLQPYSSLVAEPTLDVSVRAASNAYLEWSPPLLHAPTSLRIRDPGDASALPRDMVLWVLRVQ